jgi:LytS/YehU family sensor histidine kinase
LKYLDGYLTLIIENSKPESNNSDSRIGIGVENSKKRLLLLYPQKHRLEINETENVYSVFLEIQI